MKKLPKTTTVWLRPRDRLLIEAAAAEQRVGPSTFIRLAALEVAHRELGKASENGDT